MTIVYTYNYHVHVHLHLAIQKNIQIYSIRDLTVTHLTLCNKTCTLAVTEEFNEHRHVAVQSMIRKYNIHDIPA